MAFYEGKEPVVTMIDRIIERLTSTPQGSVDPFWRRVESGGYQAEGCILKSTGKSGTDAIFVRLKQNSNTGIDFSMIEDYQPNVVQGLVGVTTNEGPIHTFQWGTGAQPVGASINYWLSFDKDKIILTVQGDRAVTTSFKNVLFIGLPERLYTPRAGSPSAVAHFVSRYADINLTGSSSSGDAIRGIGRGLRDRSRGALPYYRTVAMTKWKSKGWGGVVLPSDIFMYHVDQEGLRARMDGVKCLTNSASGDFRDGEEITVGSKRYIVHQAWSAGSRQNCFPTDWLAVEKIQ